MVSSSAARRTAGPCTGSPGSRPHLDTGRTASPHLTANPWSEFARRRLTGTKTSPPSGVFPESLVERLHESTSFEPPNLHDRAGEEDLALLGAMELFRIVDVPDEAVVRLFAVYADAVRRLAKAEAKLYEANIEERLRASGMTERELIEFGTDFVSVNHVDAALEAEGIGRHIPQPPAICFVDLTGYTRLTEERGDRFAADVAAQLASLVRTFHASAAAARSGGLGDGGMFHFREPPRSVDAGLDMVEQAPAAGRTPAGPHRHPCRPSDLPGRRRVRTHGQIASRLASVAQAGHVVVSEEVARLAEGFSFHDIGPVALKGVAAPMRLFRAERGCRRPVRRSGLA